MKAVLLAAGVGTRLRPYTDSTPKCMIEVGGVPVIERTLVHLAGQGVHEFAVNLHHHPEVVNSHLGSGEQFASSIRYFHEDVLLGTAGALSQMRSWLAEGDFLVVYADNIIHINLASLLERHRSLHSTATMALYSRKEVHASGVAEVAADGRVNAFIEKPKPGVTDSHWISAGLLCCSPRVLDFIPDGFCDFGHNVLPALLESHEIVGGYQMTDDETLYWIDTPDDLRNTEDAITSSRIRR
jgi:NDP-sugar pyrophosphorylase family protein